MAGHDVLKQTVARERQPTYVTRLRSCRFEDQVKKESRKVGTKCTRFGKQNRLTTRTRRNAKEWGDRVIALPGDLLSEDQLIERAMLGLCRSTQIRADPR